MSVSLSANTRAALNASEGQQTAAVSALKIAADADKAIVAVIEQSVAALKASPPAGQGQNVDRTV